MQDKDKFYNSSPMKLISLEDIFNHPEYDIKRHGYYYEMISDLFMGFYTSKVEKLNYSFLPKNVRGTILVEQEFTKVYEFAKLHWLVHDFQVNGISFKPQGFLQNLSKEYKKFSLEIHPGTYRFFALLVAKMHNEYVVVADKENYFPDITPLTYEEHLKIVNEGFIRERIDSYAEIETTNLDEPIYTNQENSNHHDWNIIIQVEELAKIYSNLTIYTDDEDDICRLGLLKYEGEKNIEIKAQNKGYAYIPILENYKGVSVYIPKSENMEDVFTFDMLLHLDLDDDVVYFEDSGVIILNNSTPGCRRLITQIIEESKPEYLNKFLWARKVKRL
jgi:hypothetical protein